MMNQKIIYRNSSSTAYKRSCRQEKNQVKHILSTMTDLRRTTSFSQILQCWQQVKWAQQKVSTRQKYSYLIERHIIPELGTYTLAELTPEVLDVFIEQKLRQGRLNGTGGLSPAYVRSMAVILNAVLLFAAEENLCAPNRRTVYRPHINKREIEVLTVEEQKQLEQQLLTEPSFTGLGILLSLNTGLRIGEMCALNWADIDQNDYILSVNGTVIRKKTDAGRGELMIDTPKTPSSLRKIPIPSKLHDILKMLHKISVGEYVLSTHHTFVSPRTYEYRFHKTLERCGVRSVNYHTLRHTFATRCIELGMDVKTLSELLGHTSTATTLNTYVHTSIDLKRSQIERLSTLWD